MAKVTIEGSRTPCADLPTGERRTVEYSRGVRERVRRGFYDVVKGPFDDEAPAPVVEVPAPAVLPPVEIDPHTLTEVENPGDDLTLPPGPDSAPLEPPARNASRIKWAEFLTSRHIAFTDDDGRDDLVDLWDSANGVG